MGLIINAIFLVFLVVTGTAGYAYYHPEQAKVFIVKGLSKIAPQIIDIDLNDFIEQLPEASKEFYDKNPIKEKQFSKDIPFDDSISQETKILGRPKKIVEYFCSNDNDCRIYFKNTIAKCDSISGMCYEIT